LCFDSRKVGNHSLFVAVKGTQVNGHNFIANAEKAGARAIICEQLPVVISEKVTYLKVKNSALALSLVAHNFYDNPSEKLKLIGVTGTNGKTTTTTLLYNLFTQLGYKAGLLSTVNIKIGRQTLPATHTTPDPIYLNECLKQMVDQGVGYCFMEASSHGIVQERTGGLHFTGAVFTNISHDHLDYHGNFENYIKAKKKLFDELPKTAFALTNADSRHGQTMMQNTRAKVKTFALKTEADFKVRIIEHQLNGMLVNMAGHEVWTKLIGNFNAYNLAAIFGVASLLNQDHLQIATAISSLKSVEGRFQYIQSKEGVTAIIDYAHTPDALANVLSTIKQIRGGHEKVITVVGCGGNRDANKRPEMAQIATEQSDQVIFTSDNPRFEDPEAILQDMQAGVAMHHQQKYLSISNRKEAIKTAVKMAQAKDIILIAGKGHEKYQIIKDQKLPFDDLALVKELLNLNAS
jgi:UDP-N-acetylmuramoyl-L-alanyl-D-glutamate--2,6-diaminopimelate ligase